MKLLAIALALLLAGCATVDKTEKIGNCEEGPSHVRAGGSSAANSCKREADIASREASRKRRRPASASPRPLNLPDWFCEVEASAKVFTGVGASVEEASRSAQASCRTHFQSSSCQQAECSRNL